MLTDVGHVLVHVGGVNGKSDTSQVRCSTEIYRRYSIRQHTSAYVSQHTHKHLEVGYISGTVLSLLLCTRTKVQTLTQTALLSAILLVTKKAVSKDTCTLSSVFLALLVQKYKY